MPESRVVTPIEKVLASTSKNEALRQELLDNPKAAIEKELGVVLSDGHEFVVHEDSDINTHLVLPPKNKLSAEERAEAKAGAGSLEYLKKTMYDPAPPMREMHRRSADPSLNSLDAETLATASRECILRGIDFLKTEVNDQGAWHCIRYNTANSDVPRHFERPPFISAFCVLALQRCREPQARVLCARTKKYIAETMEYPGLWRYYQHLPTDLDSSTLCSLVINSHPWIVLERNVEAIRRNTDHNGLFLTWMLDEDEPDVVATFRIEADPVVNANVIAYLGDRAETKVALQWLATMITEGTGIEGSSKWYPNSASIYYAVARAIVRVRPVLDQIIPTLADRILSLRDANGEFANVLEAVQAVSALDCVGQLKQLDVKQQISNIIDSQREDGSWPELLAFGDQTVKWGVVGQIGHAAESVTSAFCIEALERLVDSLDF